MFDDPEREFQVLLNDEGQYSIWPTSHDCPDGWKSVGVRGVKTVCIDHIEKVWGDMRPLSLRSTMDVANI